MATTPGINPPTPGTGTSTGTVPNTDPMTAGATTTPAAQPGIIAGAAAATPAAPAPDVSNWYRSVYGRDPDQGGLDYWNKQIAAGTDPNQVFAAFSNGGKAGTEANYNASLNATTANTYTGPGSVEKNTNVDEWAKNNGVTMTPAQKAQYEAAYNTASTSGSVIDSKAVYAQFLQDHPEARGLDYGTAQQLGYKPPSPSAAVSAGGPNASEAAQYKATLLGDPHKWDVTAEQTAQGQMQRMADPNSPYYQAWATAGAQDAAARGFTGNSSIRDSGILDSVMKNATPIALNDAGTYAKSASYNADEKNQFGILNQNASNTAGQFNAGAINTRYGVDLSNATQRYGIDTNAATSRYGTDVGARTQLATANISAATSRYMSDQSAATQTAVAKMSNDSQQLISTAHDKNSVLLQSNSDAATAFNNYAATLANINGSTTMDAAAKTTTIAEATNNYNAHIDSILAQSPTSTGSRSTLDVTTAAAVKKAVDAANGVDVSKQLTFAQGGDIGQGSGN